MCYASDVIRYDTRQDNYSCLIPYSIGNKTPPVYQYRAIELLNI